MPMTGKASAKVGWLRPAIAFALMLVVYQAAEGLQTVFAPRSPWGPMLMLLSLLMAWPLGRWLGWRGYDAYGLDLGARSGRLLAGGLLLALLAKLAALAFGLSIGIVAADGAARASPATSAVLLAAFVTFVPSVAEDILTRGFLLRTVPARLGFLSYVLLSAALYTANHVWRLDWGLSEQLRLFCLGLAYAAAAWRWSSLWGAVALHWGWNLSNSLVQQYVPLDGNDVVAMRLLSAGAHLVLLAIVLLLPAGEQRR